MAVSPSKTVDGVEGGTTPPQPPEGLRSDPVAVQTPSGIEIRFNPEPHTYQVRHPGVLNEKFPDEGWLDVPSVTTVLNCDPGKADPLVAWAQRVGVKGAITVAQATDLVTLLKVTGLDQAGEIVLSLMKKLKVDTSKIKKAGGDRGTAVHDAFEFWAKSGHKPNVKDFRPEERGYVVALLKFLTDADPEPLDCEILVASVEEGFAGKYDIRFRVNEPRRIVKHHTPVRGEQYAELPPGVYLGDLKTSKDVYRSHWRQLAAYELASVECGYEPTVAQGVLHVNHEGRYKFVRSLATYEDFRAVLDVHNSEQRLKAAKKGAK
jgi:hypothetical protein